MNSAAGGWRGGVRGQASKLAKPAPAASKASIVFFPFARQRVLVKQLAQKMAAARTDESAERILQQHVARFSRSLRAKKISDAIIGRQLRGLEAAVRTELWRVVFRFPTEDQAP